MTKYYCDFCKKEIIDERCVATLTRIRGIKGITDILIHAHKECLVGFIGVDVCEDAERNYAAIKAEREAKRNGDKNDK